MNEEIVLKTVDFIMRNCAHFSVEKKTDLSVRCGDDTHYWMSAFPPTRELTKNSVQWKESEIEAWKKLAVMHLCE